MAHPFFDVLEYPWSRQEAMNFHRALYGAIPDPNQIDFYYKRCGADLLPLFLGAAPNVIWQDALGNLTRACKLRVLCDILLNDANVAAIAPAVKAVIAGKTVLNGAANPAGAAIPAQPIDGNRPDLINQSRPYFEAIEVQLNATADKKELHKWLHDLQDEIYLRLPSLEDQFPASVPELSRHVNALRRDMPALHRLSGCATLAGLGVKDIENDLTLVLESLGAAAKNKDRAALKTGKGLLDTLLGQSLPDIDGALRQAASSLQLNSLADRLGQIAEQYPGEGINATDVSLTRSLHESTQKGVDNHRVWQRIDTQVRLFLNSFGRPAELGTNWGSLKHLLEKQIVLEPQEEWAKQMTDLIQSFDGEFGANNSTAFENIFIDIREVTRERFAAADDQLLSDFSALRLIAARIAALLR